MKHLTIYTLSVLLVLSACEREAIPVNERETPGEGERITLRFEAPVTRSEIDGTTGAMTWTSGDQIAVCCTDGATKRYETVTVNTSASTAEITMGASDSRCDYAVFPASAVPASPTAAQFTAPAVVFPTTYDIRGKNAETYSPCPMVAVNSGSTLDFYHVGALVRIQLTDVPEGTAAIRVTFTGMTHITGTYNVSGAGTAGATLSLASGTGNTVTVTIDADDEYVNIPIPQGDYSALTGLSVEALDSSDATLITINHEVSWSSFIRGRGRNTIVSMVIRLIGTFGGLEIAPGNLYWNGFSWSIDEEWNSHDTYGTGYGVSSGVASSYFYFDEMGVLFEKAGYNSYSDGKIDNNLDPFDGWRLPTRADFNTLLSTRVGSIVNGSLTNKHYAFIQLTGVTYAGNSTPIGLLLFPDRMIISGKALLGMDNTTITTDVTASELNTYLNQGCVFLPCSGCYNNSENSWIDGGTYGGYLTSEITKSYLFYTCFIDTYSGPFVSQNSNYDPSSVRLVRPTTQEIETYTFAGLMLSPGPVVRRVATSSYLIQSCWNETNSYNSAKGAADGSTYFQFANTLSMTSLSFDGYNDWRVPTNTELGYIFSTGTSIRNGSTVNGTANIHYAFIRLSDIQYVNNTNASGLLVFPDNKIITGTTLLGLDYKTSERSTITNAELNVYLNQGCVFIPVGGGYTSSWASNYGSLWSSVSSNSTYSRYFYFASGNVSATGTQNKTYYYMVYTVRTAN